MDVSKTRTHIYLIRCWKLAVEYTGYYDFVYLNRGRLCVSTCREEPMAMRCKKRDYFEGKRYCGMTDCTKAYSPEQSGCHQERDFHRPTCRECAHVFASACKKLYTPEQLVDRLAEKREDSGSSDKADTSEQDRSEKADSINKTVTVSNPSPTNVTKPAKKGQWKPKSSMSKAAGTAEADLKAAAEGDMNVVITSYVENWAELDVPQNDPIAAFHILDSDQERASLINDRRMQAVVSATFQVRIAKEEFRQRQTQVVRTIAEVLDLKPNSIMVIRPSPTNLRRRQLLQDEEQESALSVSVEENEPDDEDDMTTITLIIACKDPEEIARELDSLDRNGQFEEILLNQVGMQFLSGSLGAHVLVVPKHIMLSQTPADWNSKGGLDRKSAWFIVFVSIAAVTVFGAIIVSIVVYTSVTLKRERASGSQAQKPPKGAKSADDTTFRSPTKDHTIALSPPRSSQKAHRRAISVDVGSVDLTISPPRQSHDGSPARQFPRQSVDGSAATVLNFLRQSADGS